MENLPCFKNKPQNCFNEKLNTFQLIWFLKKLESLKESILLKICQIFSEAFECLRLKHGYTSFVQFCTKINHENVQKIIKYKTTNYWIFYHIFGLECGEFFRPLCGIFLSLYLIHFPLAWKLIWVDLGDFLEQKLIVFWIATIQFMSSP